VKNSPIHRRIGYSLSGLREGWRRERSLRTHAACWGAVLLLMAALRPAPIWWGLVPLCFAIGLALELLNGAVEAVLDVLHPAHHPQIGAAKDMASAAAFVANCAAAVLVVAMLVVETGYSGP
jgi:diacylglycerol kinase (ATP)